MLQEKLCLHEDDVNYTTNQFHWHLLRAFSLNKFNFIITKYSDDVYCHIFKAKYLVGQVNRLLIFLSSTSTTALTTLP